MEALPSQNATPYVGHKDRVPEFTKFLSVAIDCITPGQVIPGCTTGFIAKGGRCVVTVAPDNLEQIEALRENPALIVAAKAQFEVNVDAKVAEKYGKELEGLGARGVFTMEDARKSRERVAAGKATEGDRRVQAFRDEFLSETGDSWQGVFQMLNHRPVNPFVDIKVLDDSIIHPEERRKQKFTAETAAVHASMLREVMADSGLLDAKPTKASGKNAPQ